MTPTTKPTTTGEPEQAGAAMDRLVAEKVMGWPWYAIAAHDEESRPYPHCYTGRRGRLYVYDGENNRTFSPSTEDVPAMLVLEKLAARFDFIMGTAGTADGVRYWCRVERPHDCRTLGQAGDLPTLAEAICRAALAALAATGGEK